MLRSIWVSSCGPAAERHVIFILSTVLRHVPAAAALAQLGGLQHLSCWLYMLGQCCVKRCSMHDGERHAWFSRQTACNNTPCGLCEADSRFVGLNTNSAPHPIKMCLHRQHCARNCYDFIVAAEDLLLLGCSPAQYQHINNIIHSFHHLYGVLSVRHVTPTSQALLGQSASSYPSASSVTPPPGSTPCNI